MKEIRGWVIIFCLARVIFVIVNVYKYRVITSKCSLDGGGHEVCADMFNHDDQEARLIEELLLFYVLTIPLLSNVSAPLIPGRTSSAWRQGD